MDPVINLVKKGYPIDEPLNSFEVNAVMHATAVLSGEKFRRLLSLKPNLSRVDRYGRTALHFACRSGNLENF